ncbi:MAG: hypothetical protein LUC39_02940 [Clostridiales bacterium]|nr:hypothetical protein [Clostridiales bacterium]
MGREDIRAGPDQVRQGGYQEDFGAVWDSGLDLIIRNPNDPDLQAEYSALENRLGRQDEAYNRFCQENGLAAQYERLRVADGEKDVEKSGDDGILEQSSKREYPVTQESIDSVPLVQPSGWSNQQATVLQKAHKELLRYVQNESEGTEAGFVCDMDGNVLERRIGEWGKVKVPVDVKECVIIHNHPDCNIFSGTDIKQFIWQENISVLTAVGNDGRVYAAIKHDVFYEGYFSTVPKMHHD